MTGAPPCLTPAKGGRVLMIAYHYPPMRGSSGIQRTLSFARHLPHAGWLPTVLSASRCAYDNPSDEPLNDNDDMVHRSFALDASRHLALCGHYPLLLAQPDRWISWWLSAVPAGLRLIRRQRPDIIWSSYPIATAHLIALTLHRLTGVPWVSDQRDPLLDTGYPANLRTRSIHRWLERNTVQHSAAIVCTTPGAIRASQQRHPSVDGARFHLIGNGYDADSFSALPPTTRAPRTQFRLLHSGLIYPSERDPRALFAALRHLLRDGAINAADFRLVLRASGHDDVLARLIEQHRIGAIVELAPALSYRAALAEMLDADGLLLLQAANCNHQIPAKLYEYLRARRPVLALTDPAGDTAAALRQAGIDTIGTLADASDIAAALRRFLQLCRAAQAPLASDATIALHSRAARTLELAALFDQVRRKVTP